jgi:hypothetical protein
MYENYSGPGKSEKIFIISIIILSFLFNFLLMCNIISILNRNENFGGIPILLFIYIIMGVFLGNLIPIYNVVSKDYIEEMCFFKLRIIKPTHNTHIPLTIGMSYSHTNIIVHLKPLPSYFLQNS